MIIISTILTAIILTSLQINPIVIARDTFFIHDSQGAEFMADSQQVLGVQETAEDLTLPVSENREITPYKKLEIAEAPEISASSALVIDVKTKKVLYGKNENDVMPIASITKLMTALVVLDNDPDFRQNYTITMDDRREGGRIYLFQGDGVTINDLFNISLIGSANTGTIALVHALGISETDFVIAMNAKAKELGLSNTTFTDPIGLSSYNTSTAHDVAKLVQAALANKKIQETVTKSSYILRTTQGKQRVIASTDNLLKTQNKYTILGGKTGHLASARFCFTGKFINDSDHDIISVILNSQGVESRFTETEALVNWVYNNYNWY